MYVIVPTRPWRHVQQWKGPLIPFESCRCGFPWRPRQGRLHRVRQRWTAPRRGGQGESGNTPCGRGACSSTTSMMLRTSDATPGNPTINSPCADPPGLHQPILPAAEDNFTRRVHSNAVHLHTRMSTVVNCSARSCLTCCNVQSGAAYLGIVAYQHLGWDASIDVPGEHCLVPGPRNQLVVAVGHPAYTCDVTGVAREFLYTLASGHAPDADGLVRLCVMCIACVRACCVDSRSVLVLPYSVSHSRRLSPALSCHC